MKLKDLQCNWNKFGENDPLWSILTHPGKEGGKWDEDDFFKTGAEEVKSVLSILSKHNVTYAKNRVLDFGCGVGRLSQAFAPHFHEVYGVDIAPSMLELANMYNRYPDKCHYVLNAKSHLRLFPENYFDFIYSNLVLQHMRPKYVKKYIREFMRILKPKGVLIFQMPCGVIKTDQANSLGRMLYPRRFLDPVKTLLKSLLKKAKNIISNKRSHHPIMEMYVIDKKVMVGLLLGCGGSVINIEHNTESGADHRGVKYYAIKGGLK